MSSPATDPADASTRARELCGLARQHLKRGERDRAADLGRDALAIDRDCIEAHVLLSELALTGEHYLDLLAKLHRGLRPQTYLEIGVAGGTSIALAGQGTLAIGIDPEPQIQFALPPSVRIFRETSDEFFSRRTLHAEFGGRPLDLAFIDGMHLFEYALRDFINIERNGTARTVVLYHDCYPLDEVTASRDRVTRFWTGDVWKLTACLKKYRPDLQIHTLAARPTGLGVIHGLDPHSTVLPANLEALCREFVPMPYSALGSGKHAALNLVPGDWNALQKLIGAPGLDRAELLRAALEHHQAGRLPQAEALYRQVLAANPEDADALGLLGRIAHQAGKFEIAIELLGRASRLQARNPFAANYLGEACAAVGRLGEAEEHFRRATLLTSGYAEAHNNLGVVLANLGRAEEAESSYRRALEANPEFVEAYSNLATSLRNLGRLAEAEQSYREALARRPDFAEVWSNLGATLGDLGRLAEAEQCYRRALSINPRLVLAHDNLGLALLRLGRLEEAEGCYRQALAIEPAFAEAYGHLIALLNYIPGRSAADIYAEHREFARRYGRPADPAPYANGKELNRRLRVGYISGDFRDHSVAFFIEPVLEKHNRKAFEVFCYYNFPRADAVTGRLKALADHWRDVAALDDGALADLIRADRIDILVDLSGHTAHNRLLALSRKPAPVQVTWLGYLNTTGLDAMDYRITDAYASPEGLFDAFHTEALVRLEGSQWCYRPQAGYPAVAPPPGVKSGFITFGAFTNLAKLGQPVIDLWSRVLEKSPGSRLLIVGRGLAAAGDDLVARFARNGVAAGRISLQEFGPFQDYLALHGAVDIVLDTFPYTGGTTTCHALWMGVPVVTVTGDTAASRGGASLLNAVGLGELVAQTDQQYIDIASGLASNPGRLAEMRAAMRERMAASPLMDETRFTRQLEQAFRAMWRTWCKKTR